MLLYIGLLLHIGYLAGSMRVLSTCRFPCSGSVYNLYTDEDEEAEPSPSGQQIIENSITMNKMKLLKAKMENMNLSKKVKLLALGQAFLSLTLAGRTALRAAGNCGKR